MLARDNIHCLDAWIVLRLCLPKPRGSFAWIERISKFTTALVPSCVFSFVQHNAQHFQALHKLLSQLVLFQYFHSTRNIFCYFWLFQDKNKFSYPFRLDGTELIKTHSELENAIAYSDDDIDITWTTHSIVVQAFFLDKSSWGTVDEQHQKLFHQLCIKLWIFLSLFVFSYGRIAPCTSFRQQSAFSACFWR